MVDNKYLPAAFRQAARIRSQITGEDAPAAAIDVDQIDRSINGSLRKQVSDAIMKNPELVLSVLRGWKDENQ